jgi:hypothetical protein
MVLAASANDKFANAALGVGDAIGSLRCEALVIVVVAVEDDVGIGLVKCVEQRLYGEVVAMCAAGAEERLVPVGKRASGRMRGEIRAKPLFLW